MVPWRGFFLLGGGQVSGLREIVQHHCTVPEPGEFVRVLSTVVRVTSVDGGSDEFPLIEVLYPSGRKGAYGLATIGRVRDQGQAAERYRAMGGEV